jgi:putative ABC transport system permease protein
MLRLTRRSLWEHKRRLISTVVAIVLGVAFMAGTFVLTDTIDRTFDDLFATANAEVDAQVQGHVTLDDPLMGDQRALLDASLVDTVKAIDGVEEAVPFVVSVGFGSANRILGADGDALGATQGPPTLFESWVDLPEISPYNLSEGRGPEADDEIAINVAAAEDGDLEVGDQVEVLSQFGRTPYKLVGLFTFGTAKSQAGAVGVDFTLREVQRLAGTDGRIQQVLVTAEPGLSQQDLVDRIAPVLPADAEVITGVAAAKQLSKDVQSGFAFFKTALQVFGAIALLVGIFVISNTFSILVAQRTRELALLRAVGARRSQVLASVLLEAVMVGLVSAGLGLLGGVGLAQGVTKLFEAFGADLPSKSLAVRPGTIVTSVVIGLGVTLVAALIPAIRATRVPPLAALRDVAIDRSGASRLRLALGIIVTAFGGLNLSRAWTADDSGAIPTVGLGAVLLIIGAIVIGPVLAGPTIRALGAVLHRITGVTGKLAMENAARSPKRTSATASALLIGVALVGFITVFASSAKSSVTAEVERGFKGDFVVQAGGASFGPPSGFPATVADQIGQVPGVKVAIGVGFARAEITYPDGETAKQFIASVEPEGFTQVLEPRMVSGDITKLSDAGVLIDKAIAKSHRIRIGDGVTIAIPGGDTLELKVEGLSDDQTLLGNVTMTRDAFNAAAPQQLDIQVFGKLDRGADYDTVSAAVEKVTDQVPGLDVLDREGFIGDLASQITSFVTVIYGLLVLSIIIALIGIANTLSLSINERTRELGLLRAVGMNKRQLRAAIRWEAVLISVLGTIVGLGLGLGLSYAMIQVLSTVGLSQYSVPVVQLAAIAVMAAVLGTLASIRPSRRAARMAILDAIATE